MTALLVMIAVVVCVVLLCTVVLALRPSWLVDRRRAAEARWVGMVDLTDQELRRVVVLRGMGMAAADVRDRICHRRAVEEELRRSRELARRQMTGQRSRAARRRRGRRG